MAYYDDADSVEQYIGMAEGYDGKALIALLRQYLPDKSSVLELGMGAGKDLLLLSEHYTVTGSDFSEIFVERFRKEHPHADLLQLDAVTLPTERQFDALYSNKVLYHLTVAQLKESFARQQYLLKSDGIALHSFWYGEGHDSAQGLHFEYYTEATLREVIGATFEILDIQRYTEMDENDSLVVILKKHS